MRTLVIIGLAYILFIHGLGGTSLWDPDEPRQAIMAREMVQRADYVHPYLNGSPYLEKPPLYSWLIIFASKLTGGIDEFASRLPSAIAATLLLLLTYFLGKRLDHEVSGFLSALILATNYQFLGNARESVMDMTFAFFIGLAVFLGYLCVEKGKKGLLPLALLPCALAIVTKGPVGIIVPVAVLFFYCIATRNLKAMFGPLVLGFLLALAVASLWFGLAGKAYMNEFILHQNINRFTTGFDHIEPFTYYFQKLLTNFLPWSIALPFAAFFAFRRRLWLPLIWLLVTFVFFDISKSKRAIYILCCYPACALLVGIYLKERWYVLVEKGWTTAILSILSLGLLALPALLFPAMHRVPMVQEMLGKDPLFPAALVVIFAASGLAFFLSILQKSPGKGFLALFIYLVCLAFLYHSMYLPFMDREQKSVTLITDAMHGAQKRHPVYMYGFNSPALIYYVGKPVTILQSPAELPAEKDDIILVVEDKGDNTEPFRGLFPSAKSVRYERADYIVFTGAHAR
jgi:4-amino-4-deoxy-L-arabinose transferase-like glycosyltransferase